MSRAIGLSLLLFGCAVHGRSAGNETARTMPPADAKADAGADDEAARRFRKQLERDQRAEDEERRRDDFMHRNQR